MIRTLLASGLLATSTVLAAAQNSGSQPVPGAMPDSDDIPSTMSTKNAHDDALPVAAFRLKHLTDAQRQAIYQSVLATAKSDAAPLAAPGVDVGMVLSRNARLDPLPPEATAVTPEMTGLQYHLTGNRLVLADPVYRQVLAVISQQ
jgi:hypothetical protein